MTKNLFPLTVVPNKNPACLVFERVTQYVLMTLCNIIKNYYHFKSLPKYNSLAVFITPHMGLQSAFNTFKQLNGAKGGVYHVAIVEYWDKSYVGYNG